MMSFACGIMFFDGKQCAEAYITFNHGIMRVNTINGATRLLTSNGKGKTLSLGSKTVNQFC